VSRLVDLTGRTFGLLTVVGRGPSDVRGKACWRCRCACGGETLVIGDNLRRGNTRSCGCAAGKPAPRVTRLGGGPVLPPLPARTRKPKAAPDQRDRCANCTAGRHGRWCCASLFGPWCPCGCRAVLGLAGPFDGGDPSVPWWDERLQGVA